MPAPHKRLKLAAPVICCAPSNETIETGTEMSFGGDGQIVYVYNHSSVPIVVTGLHLIDCENIKNSCDVQRLRVQVNPIALILFASTTRGNSCINSPSAAARTPATPEPRRGANWWAPMR